MPDDTLRVRSRGAALRRRLR